MQADILTTVILPLSLFIIMFGMGLSLQISDFTRVFEQPKAVLVGLSAQILALPLFALLIAITFALPPELAVGLMIISFAPGGVTSNVFTNLAKGDVALSISLTAITSLIISFTIPVFTVLSMDFFMGEAENFELPVLKTIIQLLVITVIPVALGMFILSKWQTVANKIEPFIQKFSIVILMLLVMAIILKNKAQMVEFFLQTGAATLVLNLFALYFGYRIAKLFTLNEKESISIGYEVGIQNGTLALLVAGTLIGNNTMMIPAVTYSILMFITAFGFGLFLKKHNQSTHG
jgi:BASS family bile acid:Na+ symporter